MIEVPTARDVMSTAVLTVSADADVYDAIDTLAHKSASAVPVLDSAGALVGILTEKDCLRVLTLSAYGSLAGGKVSDFMSPVAFTVTPGMDLFTVAQIFLAGNFASLPVIEEGKLIGRISRQDMLHGIQRLQHAADVKRARDGQAMKIMQNPESVEELQKFAGSQKREQMAAVLSRRHGPDHQR